MNEGEHNEFGKGMDSEKAKPQNPSPFLVEATPLPRASGIPIAYRVAAAYVIVTAAIIAAIPSEPDSRYVSEYFVVAILFGSLFGQTTCASIWSSLGTGQHWVRLTLTLGWFLILVAGMAVLAARMNGPGDEIVIIWAGTMLVQSLIIQVPLWIVRTVTGLRLAVHNELVGDGSERVQFRIMHMMFFTAFIAIVIGIGQGLIRLIGTDITRLNDGWPIFLYLAGSAILVSLPVAAASLLERHLVPALLVAVVLVVLVTAAAYPMMQALGLQRNGPNLYHIVSINASVAMVVLVYCLGLRYFGFRLTIGQVAQPLPAKS
jgi:hypothetical protein